MFEYMCKYLNKLWNNMVKVQRRKKTRRLWTRSSDSRRGDCKVHEPPDYHSEILSEDLEKSIEDDLVYRDWEIYFISRHLAMFLLILYTKRPVVISSLPCNDMDKAIIKRTIEETKADFNPKTPVYLCMARDYAGTAFTPVVVLSPVKGISCMYVSIVISV